jgi:phage head maturation protease
MEIDNLIDVGPVTFPAYPDATAEADKRDYDSYLEANPRETPQPANVPCEWQRNLREKELELYK